MANGLLIDYRWCTGCHTCEIACRKQLGLADDDFGIKLTEFIWPIKDQDKDWQHIDTWQYTYLPTPLDACNLCADRTALGKPPSCVQHCQAKCIEYGQISELVKKLTDHPKQSLFYLG